MRKPLNFFQLMHFALSFFLYNSSEKLSFCWYNNIKKIKQNIKQPTTTKTTQRKLNHKQLYSKNKGSGWCPRKQGNLKIKQAVLISPCCAWGWLGFPKKASHGMSCSARERPAKGWALPTDELDLLPDSLMGKSCGNVETQTVKSKSLPSHVCGWDGLGLNECWTHWQDVEEGKTQMGCTSLELDGCPAPWSRRGSVDQPAYASGCWSWSGKGGMHVWKQMS